MTIEALPEKTDVAIAGGGMVGLSLALLLARACPELSILVLEAHPLPGTDSGEFAFPPSFDARSTALSPSSRALFEQLSLWPSLEAAAAAIETIQVSDRGRPGATRLHAAEEGFPALGYVIENRCLGHILLQAVREYPNIRLLAPARVDHLRPGARGMGLVVGEDCCRASLAVIADGARSPLLSRLGIETEVTDYGQTALIANVALARPHDGIAYERFTERGPMALLPLPPVDTQSRAALVWTLPPEEAARLQGLPDQDFLPILSEHFGARAGQFQRSGERVLYPLALAVAREQVRHHLVVAGNAAHFLHPVAGQGFNLALRDIAVLAEVLISEHGRRGLGDLSLLERYLARQRGDQRRTILFSDALPRIFAARDWPTVAARNAGLIAMDLLPGLRGEFARFGAGLVTPGPRPNTFVSDSEGR